MSTGTCPSLRNLEWLIEQMLCSRVGATSDRSEDTVWGNGSPLRAVSSDQHHSFTPFFLHEDAAYSFDPALHCRPNLSVEYGSCIEQKHEALSVRCM